MSSNIKPKQAEDLLIAFSHWSKLAEWREGTKQQFIRNDWHSYINEFFKMYHTATFSTK